MHFRTSQVEEPVAEAEIFGHRHFGKYGERKGCSGAEDFRIRNFDLHFTCRHAWIDLTRFPGNHDAIDAYHGFLGHGLQKVVHG